MAVAAIAAFSADVAVGNWSEIPEDIAVLILDLVCDEIANLISFGAVCSWWRSVMQKYNQMYRPTNQFPWRLLGQSKDGALRSTLRFHSLSNQKHYSVDVPPNLPRQIVGYSNGFIGLLPRSGKGLLRTYNPVTGAHFTFPKIRTSRLPFIKFIVNTTVSNNNNSSKCTHAAFLTTPCCNGKDGQLVSIAKVGHTRWRYFNLIKYKKIDAYCIDDILFHKDRLYVITRKPEHTLLFDLSGSSYLVNLDQLHPMADLILSHKARRAWWTKFVQSSDKNDLFLIVAYSYYLSSGFVHEVFRFDECGDRWDIMGSVFTQFSIYREDGGMYSLCRWQFLPLRVRHELCGISSDRSTDKFIAIDAVNEAEVDLKIYNCNDDLCSRWFFPSF